MIVDFWAEWCGPCHAVSPVLDRIGDEHQVKIVKVNIDEQQDLAQRYGVASIPFMVLFEGGEPQASAIGAMPKGSLEKALGLAEAQASAPDLSPRQSSRNVWNARCLARYCSISSTPRVPVADPGLGEIVLDQVERAAIVHVPIIGATTGGRMSRSAHLSARQAQLASLEFDVAAQAASTRF